jgi:hypothetical protein
MKQTFLSCRKTPKLAVQLVLVHTALPLTHGVVRTVQLHAASLSLVPLLVMWQATSGYANPSSNFRQWRQTGHGAAAAFAS